MAIMVCYSPHIDRLFEYGFISFTDKGEVLVSPKLNREVLRIWNIDPDKNIGSFLPEQCIYLKYHRENRFRD